jgi:hypothetical protein
MSGDLRPPYRPASVEEWLAEIDSDLVQANNYLAKLVDWESAKGRNLTVIAASARVIAVFFVALVLWLYLWGR